MKRTGQERKHGRSSRIGYLGFEVIGAYKLASGLLALALGIWTVCFLDHDPLRGLERVTLRLGLDPQNHIIHSAIAAVTGVNRKHLRAIEAGTFAYAILHLVEGIGLLQGRDWAGYLVVLATGSLIPFDIVEIARKPSWLRISILILNVAIVIFLCATMRKEHMAEVPTEPREAPGSGALL